MSKMKMLKSILITGSFGICLFFAGCKKDQNSTADLIKPSPIEYKVNFPEDSVWRVAAKIAEKLTGAVARSYIPITSGTGSFDKAWVKFMQLHYKDEVERSQKVTAGLNATKKWNNPKDFPPNTWINEVENEKATYIDLQGKSNIAERRILVEYPNREGRLSIYTIYLDGNLTTFNKLFQGFRLGEVIEFEVKQ